MNTLESEIAEFDKIKATKLPSSTLAVMAHHTELLAKSGVVERAASTLVIGNSFPDVELPDVDGRLVNIKSIGKGGPLVLVFYRGGWCPYCNMELRAWQKQLAELRTAGANIVAISPEQPVHAATTVERAQLDFQILVDKDNMLAHKLNTAFHVADELAALYLSLGIDLDGSQGNSERVLPLPVTLVLDEARNISWRFIDADYTRRAEPADVIQAVRSLAQDKA